MAWPADWTDGEGVTASRLNSWTNAIKAWGGDVDSGGYSVIVMSSAPTDGNIPTKGIAIWIDEVSNQLKFRIRYSDGTTLKTGAVNLT